MYQVALANLQSLPLEIRNQPVHMSDGSRPTVEEILNGRPASAPAEAPDQDVFALEPYLETEIPGTEFTVGQYLAQAEEGNAYARALLARHGIRHESGMLHLNLSQDLLLRLLISPLLREPGARLDPKTGTLSIPLSIA